MGALVIGCPSEGGSPTNPGDGSNEYEPVPSWNVERARELLATDSFDIIFIGDSWSVPHLRNRPMLTFAREVDFAEYGGLNGLFLGAVNAGMSDAGQFYRVQTGLSTNRPLGLSTGDYRYVREKYFDPPVYNGIPVGGVLEGRVDTTTTLAGNAGYCRISLDQSNMVGVNFAKAPLGQIGESTVFRFILVSEPDHGADLIQFVEAGTSSTYGGDLTPFDLHNLVEDQAAEVMKDFALTALVAPFTGARTMTLWPQDNLLPGGDPIRYITLRNCGILAADAQGGPLQDGTTLRALADSSYSLISLASDTPSSEEAPKRYTTAEVLAWMKATKVKRNALVFLHFAVENGDQSEINAQLSDSLDRLESVLPQAGYEEFCIIPIAMAHMITGRDYDTSMQRVREWNAEFLAAARARPQTTAFVNLLALSGGFMMVDGWRGQGDDQGLTIPPDNQENWQNWMREHGFDEFELWDGTIVDLSAMPTLFDGGRLHLNGTNSSAAAAFFYRALLWNEILFGITSPAQLSAFTIVRGSLVSGGLDQLLASDDEWLRTRSALGFSALEPNLLELRIEAETDVPAAVAVAIRIESRINSPGGTARLRLRRWASGVFEQVHQYAIGQAELTEVVDGLPADRYVRESAAADIELSVRHAVMVTFSINGFDSFFDTVQLGVK